MQGLVNNTLPIGDNVFDALNHFCKVNALTVRAVHRTLHNLVATLRVGLPPTARTVNALPSVNVLGYPNGYQTATRAATKLTQASPPRTGIRRIDRKLAQGETLQAKEHVGNRSPKIVTLRVGPRIGYHNKEGQSLEHKENGKLLKRCANTPFDEGNYVAVAVI